MERKKPQINVIGSIGEDLIENIRDFTNILEKMRDEIAELKEKANKTKE